MRWKALESEDAHSVLRSYSAQDDTSPGWALRRRRSSEERTPSISHAVVCCVFLWGRGAGALPPGQRAKSSGAAAHSRGCAHGFEPNRFRRRASALAKIYDSPYESPAPSKACQWLPGTCRPGYTSEVVESPTCHSYRSRRATAATDFLSGDFSCVNTASGFGMGRSHICSRRGRIRQPPRRPRSMWLSAQGRPSYRRPSRARPTLLAFSRATVISLGPLRQFLELLYTAMFALPSSWNSEA